MTEAEWLACEDPRPMLEHLRGLASARKLRLFAVACCRSVWRVLADESSRKAVEVAERHADGGASDEELAAAQEAAAAGLWTRFKDAAVRATNLGAGLSARMTLLPVDRAFRLYIQPSDAEDGSNPAGRRALAGVVREVFGNPFRPVSVDPAWLAGDGGTVPRLAHAVYGERAFDRLPDLADALESAGCPDQQLLAHCRGTGPHFRGCWAVDLLLGKS
jgi:hypothetical protein